MYLDLIRSPMKKQDLHFVNLFHLYLKNLLKVVSVAKFVTYIFSPLFLVTHPSPDFLRLGLMSVSTSAFS